MSRHATSFAAALVALTFGAAALSLTPAFAQATAKPASTGQKPPASVAKPAPRWVMPRTADGKPDLQGNWTNETQTPLERMGAQGGTLTDEQARKVEDRARFVEEYRDK